MALFFLVFGGCLVLWSGSRLVLAGMRRSISDTVRQSRRRPRALGRRLSFACALALALSCLLSAIGLGDPVYGLGVLFLLPPLLPWGLRLWSERETAALDASALAFFHALQGLVASGLGLPYALFRLTESLPSPFSLRLQPFLEHFRSGRSLEHCLERFRGRVELRLTGVCLVVLQLAYREGLPICPFLDRILPMLEAEREGRERVAALRRSAAAQAAVAFAVPWCLALVLSFFQPGLLREIPLSRAAWWIGGALLWEALGVWVLWNVSTFC